jgi:hypothetical protein
MSLAPGVVPSHNSYAVTPVPAVQSKVTVELENVVPGVGVVSTAAADVPEAMYVYAFDWYVPSISENSVAKIVPPFAGRPVTATD